MSRNRLPLAKSSIPASKDDTQFREALKLYESKQYKKALKLVETTLKKNSHHAESLTLKGLILYNTDLKEEADVYINKGIAKNPDNSIVNHMAGIYYRSEKDYVNAAKWFKLAVENGASNINILKDLSIMQLQIRDYKNLKDSRQQYLEAEPRYRAHWTSNAIAYHLNKDYKVCESILTKFEEMAEGKLSEGEMYEHSECLLYKNMVMGESGDFQKALTDLDNIEPHIKDKLSVLEYRARYLLLLGESKKASLVYRQLLKINPDNSSYYYLLEAALGVASPEIRLKLYEKLESFYPRSDPPKYIPLTFLSGDAFKSKVKTYLYANLQRGVPSTFVNVKPLYKNTEKLKIIESLVLEFFESDSLKSPTTWVWACYFLAQHYLYLNDIPKSSEYINKAIEHSPTLVELYIFKARVLKHERNFVGAANVMNEGRELDLQDRFVNSKSTKYYFRANMIDEAINTISMFTKHENSVNGLKDLHSMQANWVLIESAEAYYRIFKELNQKYQILPALAPDADEEEEKNRRELKENIEINKGLSLKRFQSVISIFKDYYNDQLDFHSYCMRRGTARAYVDMLKWCDILHATPIYSRVVFGLSKLYFEIDDELTQKSQEADDGDVKIKKNNKKAKKEKAKDIKRKEELIAKVASVTDDKDPFGSSLIAITDPLEELFKVFKPLSVEADDRINTWIIGYELYLRQKKYLLALQSINKLKKITNDKYPYIGSFVLRLKEAANNDATSAEPIKKVVQKSLDTSYPKLSELGEDEFLKLYTQTDLKPLFI